MSVPETTGLICNRHGRVFRYDISWLYPGEVWISARGRNRAATRRVTWETLEDEGWLV